MSTFFAFFSSNDLQTSSCIRVKQISSRKYNIYSLLSTLIYMLFKTLIKNK